MSDAFPAPTTRFSDRVENYVRYRPSYGPEVRAVIESVTGLRPPATVADIGSGTGLSADLFLPAGYSVWGIEPNAAMRQAAEQRVGGNPLFHSQDGTAEATGLPDDSMDLVIAAQAFHWFQPEAARTEFRRILRPGGWVAIVFHSRRTDSTPFLRDYEQLLLDYGTDYRTVRHENSDVAAFFSHGCTQRVLCSEQRFDLVGLRGRILSSSYTPAADDSRYVPMLAAIDRLFATHQRDGAVCIEYDTQITLGQL
jgi:SAM-dependent methyltransferase